MVTRPNDITIRLPASKKHLKQDLLKIAQKNGWTLTQLMIFVIEWFIEARKEKNLSVKIK